jgi:uncharacterized small protein (DUF1192 family)
MGREQQAPAPAVPVVPPTAGSIEALRAEASQLQAERARTTDPARIADINNRLATINAEIQRLESLGLPEAPGARELRRRLVASKRHRHRRERSPRWRSSGARCRRNCWLRNRLIFPR